MQKIIIGNVYDQFKGTDFSIAMCLEGHPPGDFTPYLM